VIKKCDVAKVKITDKIKESKVAYTYFDGDSQELIESEEATGEAGADVVKGRQPVQSRGQQQSQAAAKARGKKSSARTGSLEIEGNTALRAGCNIELQGFGAFDLLWKITKATHSVTESGFKVAIEFNLT
jgi:phage protein D